MNGFTVLGPVGIPQKSSRKALQRVENLEGRRLGFIWGMHELSTKFWPVLEEEVIDAFKPTEVHRVHKNDKTDGRAKGNTWLPAPQPVIEETASRSIMHLGVVPGHMPLHDTVNMVRLRIPSVSLSIA
jgi:hypothetical protein